ncbi:hypothetical protein IEQ34_004657 [Dendrobium chrysotoxum]|uniref:Uncharacterized protein n=1 Tax=Dendrobium chrysotoxum TaxID=161865 RepID=A0AAV7HHV3_DENCH|nr:hypothetical protein IEQ34_004657 [Dendrobium chrysotoxum]
MAAPFSFSLKVESSRDFHLRPATRSPAYHVPVVPTLNRRMALLISSRRAAAATKIKLGQAFIN